MRLSILKLGFFVFVNIDIEVFIIMIGEKVDKKILIRMI